MDMSFGKTIHVDTTGTSHGDYIEGTATGFPKGESIDLGQLKEFLKRRSPGKMYCSGRKEEDNPEIISGLDANGRTDGNPICIRIMNHDARSEDYEKEPIPRPGHADISMWNQEKIIQPGGGAYSGRLTCPITAIGGIAKQILEHYGIQISAHILSIGKVKDTPYSLCPTQKEISAIGQHELPVINEESEKRMKEEIQRVSEEADSVGGTIECVILNCPKGIGEARFNGLENKLGSILFGIPGLKGLSFGSGFDGATTYGSLNNDEYIIADGTITTKTNHAGGLLGGVTTGMPIVFQVAMKPTPTIGKPQKTVNLNTNEPVILKSKGRHDPCIAIRAVPVIESMASLATLEMLLEAMNEIKDINGITRTN